MACKDQRACEDRYTVVPGSNTFRGGATRSWQGRRRRGCGGGAQGWGCGGRHGRSWGCGAAPAEGFWRDCHTGHGFRLSGCFRVQSGSYYVLLIAPAASRRVAAAAATAPAVPAATSAIAAPAATTSPRPWAAGARDLDPLFSSIHGRIEICSDSSML